MSLEGWVPDVGDYLTLAEVVEFAFDYRGNTTIVKRDGTEIVGYIFNRNTYGSESFIEYFDESGEGPRFELNRGEDEDPGHSPPRPAPPSPAPCARATPSSCSRPRCPCR